MPFLSRRGALAVGVVAVTIAPLALGTGGVAGALSPALHCRGVSTEGAWQKVGVDPFRPVQGVPAQDTVTAYAVSEQHPGSVVATNGTVLQRSLHSGCDWADVLTLDATPSANLPVSGQTAKIVAAAILPTGRVLAAVREGTGPASRPHVLGSDNGAAGTFSAADTGLPPQGSPKLIESSTDGRVVYLVVTPVPEDGTGAGSLPEVPPVDLPTSSGGKAGLLYASTDGGRTWAMRTSVSDLLGGDGLDQLAIDRGDPDLLYATSNGLLYLSRDGGRTFVRAQLPNDGVTAIATMTAGSVAVFTRSGVAMRSVDSGRTFLPLGRTLPGITSAAYRSGDPRLAIEANGLLALFDTRSGFLLPAPGPHASAGSLRGDVGSQSTFHGLFEHTLLRYVDPTTSSDSSAVSVDDLGVPPPPPGRISPGTRTVQLPVGSSGVFDYTLAMPKSPTPLDLFFLIDTSGSMSPYIENLKANISKITHAVQSAGINLQVGVGTLGTGPRPGEVVAPNVDPSNPTDGGSQLYRLFRRIGPIDAGFAKALASVTIKNQSGNNPAEAQLAALEQATWGPGIQDPRSTAAAPVYLVKPGQDAGWRKAPGIRRIIVHATDEAFDKPAGSPLKNGELDFGKVIREMNRFSVQQIGITTGAIESRDDLAKIAAGTGTVAPPGGADCGEGVLLPAGRPLVCDTEGDFSALIGRLVRSLQDRATVGLATSGKAPQVVPLLDAPALQRVDVTRPNRLPFRVTVSCRTSPPGRYAEDVVASLRGVTIATSTLTVSCVGPALAAVAGPKPPAPEVPLPNNPPPAPVVVAAFAPAPPAAQPVGQPQPNVQAQPLTAAATQQQEELQLALALQAGEEQAEPDDVLAMVGLRRKDESAALVLLVSAMAASSALGLARLRTRTAPSAVRVRR